MCQHTENYDDCPECHELTELRSMVEDLETEDKAWRKLVEAYKSDIDKVRDIAMSAGWDDASPLLPFLKNFCDHAQTRINELEAWKESALTVLNDIDLQAVGKELGVKLGESVGPKILPGIRDLKVRIAHLAE